MEIVGKVVSMVLLCMVVIATHAEAAITCSQVASGISPCITYLRSGGEITASCCNGIKSLDKTAQTTPDRQTACKCLKTLANSIGNINFSHAAQLPGKCGVKISYEISPSIDCSKVR